MDCVGATTKANFDKMSTSLTRSDKATFDWMLLEGSLIDIDKGTKVRVTDMGFGWAKVRVGSRELYVLSNCVGK